jgi:predicted transcriptional regulator
MAVRTNQHPTQLELIILKILWEESPLPVRDVRQRLADQGRDLAHTSVITTLNTMCDKKQLSRKKDGKAFLFSPKIKRDRVLQSMLGDIVDRAFDGSASALMLSLFDRSDIDADEVRELRRLLDQKARELKK